MQLTSKPCDLGTDVGDLGTDVSGLGTDELLRHRFVEVAGGELGEQGLGLLFPEDRGQVLVNRTAVFLT